MENVYGIILNVNANENYVLFSHVVSVSFNRPSHSHSLSFLLVLSLFWCVYKCFLFFFIMNKRPWAPFFAWSSWFQSVYKIKVCHFSMKIFLFALSFTFTTAAVSENDTNDMKSAFKCLSQTAPFTITAMKIILQYF